MNEHQKKNLNRFEELSDRARSTGIYTYSTFVFDEFDDAGKKFGNFKGTISGEKISGKFIKDGKEMPFSMDSN